MEDRMVLHDNDAERYVVGGLMNNQELYYSVSDRIKPALFWNPKISRTVRIIIEIYKNGEKADMIAVSQYMISHPDANNPEPFELAEYFGSYISGAFDQHFNLVESLYIRRRYYELGVKMMEFGTNPVISEEDIRKDIASVMEEGVEKTKRVKSLRDANVELRKRVDDNYNGTSETMICTGIKDIDEHGGLQTSDFDVIAAEPSQGKTSLLNCIMVYAATAGVPCMQFSMEMMSHQIAARIAAPRAKISSGIIQYKKLSDWQMNELSQALKQTDGLPIYFDDESTISFDSIVASIRANVWRFGIKLVGIDYLQILASTGNGSSNQEQFLGMVCRKLKNLAKELQICIVALSQLSRNISDPKPTLSRVRASGQIVEAADTVVMIWRPSEYGKGYDEFPAVPTQGTAELIIGKGRNIGTFSTIVAFDKATTSFSNYEGEVKRIGEIKISGSNHKEEKKDEPLPSQEPEQGQLPF